jgi:hypothetical protein
MFSAYCSVRFAFKASIKTVRRIRTPQVKKVGSRELVPELLKFNRSFVLSPSPEHRNHLAEYNHPLVVSFGCPFRSPDYRTKFGEEPRSIWPSFIHEFQECLLRVE